VAKTALICGVSGQTGSYLARHLVDLGYTVVGTSRYQTSTDWWRLERLGIRDDVEVMALDLLDSLAIDNTVDAVSPDEIYYLAGPSSVADSFRTPMVSMDHIFRPVVSLLDMLARRNAETSFVNAASTDCFGNQPSVVLSETSDFRPVSPYGIAKAASFWATQNYREAFGVNSRNGILTNHESPLRGPHFVTQKIVQGLKEVKAGTRETVVLGNIDIARDWVWAGDVAQALHLIGSTEHGADYVVASGNTHTLSDFVSTVCEALELRMSDVVTSDPQLFRPTDINSVRLDPTKIQSDLGWRATVSFEDMISNLIHDVVA
jgi:GDPmannose 4,6-dehydratase